MGVDIVPVIATTGRWAIATTLALTMATTAQASEAPRTISFSGYTWTVKASAGQVGPGPNVFSDDPASVAVDSQGRLHMRIRANNGVWTSAEVINQTHLGYGTYRWAIDGDVTALAPQAVLGMFTWSDDPAHANREIDIEFTKWGDPVARKTGWYTIQTGTYPSPAGTNFTLRKATSSVHTMIWKPGQVQFQSTSGGRSIRWTYTGTPVPPPGDETPRINLWLYEGAAPGPGTLDVIVRSFTFTPLA